MKIKILFLLFLSLNLYSQEPFKIEKEYINYEKYNKHNCSFGSKIIYYYKNKFWKKIDKSEYCDMVYLCYHGLIYFTPRGEYSYTQTPTHCRCEDKGVWIDREGFIKLKK